MVAAFQEQQVSAAAQSLAFDERLAMLVDRELITRDNKRMKRLLNNARLNTAKPASKRCGIARLDSSISRKWRNWALANGYDRRRI